MSLMTFVKEMKVTSFSPSKAFLPLGKAQQ